MGGGEDLGVDDAQEEHGDGVDDGDAEQADRDSDHIRTVVTFRNDLTGKSVVKSLEN